MKSIAEFARRVVGEAATIFRGKKWERRTVHEDQPAAERCPYADEIFYCDKPSHELLDSYRHAQGDP